MAEDIKHPVM